MKFVGIYWKPKDRKKNHINQSLFLEFWNTSTTVGEWKHLSVTQRCVVTWWHLKQTHSGAGRSPSKSFLAARRSFQAWLNQRPASTDVPWSRDPPVSRSNPSHTQHTEHTHSHTWQTTASKCTNLIKSILEISFQKLLFNLSSSVMCYILSTT